MGTIGPGNLKWEFSIRPCDILPWTWASIVWCFASTTIPFLIVWFPLVLAYGWADSIISSLLPVFISRSRLTLSPCLLLLFVFMDSSAWQSATGPLLLVCSWIWTGSLGSGELWTGRLGSRESGFRTKKSVARFPLFSVKGGGISMTIGKKMQW